MELLDEVKQINIMQVAEDLGFKIVHNRKLVCPFHQEDSASLVFYPLPQNEFHCFGCGKHGDVINFYADVNNLDFKTALLQLAYTYLPGYANYQKGVKNKSSNGVALKKKIITKIEDKPFVFKELYSEIYESFADFCLKLPANDVAKEAFKYLTERGFTEKTIRDFRLFVVKDYAAVSNFLKKKYEILHLQEAGLFNERGNLVFFKHVLVLPFYRENRIIYLQGRVIGTPLEGMNKYQFLSGVPRPIFNLDILKTLKTNQFVYITEGAIDCMTLVQNGMPAVSLGSASTYKKAWAKLFQRFEVVVYFDNDNAGRESGLDLCEQLTLAGISVHRKYLPPEFKDINEYYLKR